MAHGIYTDRDFQVSLQMAWHKLTTLAQPKLECFPEILPMELHYNGGKSMTYGNRKFMVPVAQDDMLPVAPPYCGETIVEDDADKKCPAKDSDRRGSYILFTPREAWAWVSEVLTGTGYNVQSIGMLWNRSFWFISTELTELKSLSLGDGRKTDFNLNFSGGLDRTVSPQCELSAIVAVCHNTISLSRSMGKVLFSERATKNFSDRLAASKGEVEKAVGMAAVFNAAMSGLADIPCTLQRAERIFAGYVTPEGDKKMGTRTVNTVKDLVNLHSHGVGNVGKTEFDLLNAYTERMTHGSTEAKTSLGRRFASSEYGNAADSKADFLRVLTTDRGIKLDAIETRGQELLAATV